MNNLCIQREIKKYAKLSNDNTLCGIGGTQLEL